MLMRYRFSDIQMVRLVTGQEKTEILVHENVLFEASPVFKAAFASEFKESSERSIYLPDDDATIMGTMIHCLYALKSRVGKIDETGVLLRLYVLADKYDIVKVKNQTCKRVLSLLESGRRKHSKPPLRRWYSHPRISDVKFVYENTPSTAPLRRLLVDWFVWGFWPDWFDDERRRNRLMSVPEFAVDVCAVLGRDFNKRAKERLFMRRSSLYLEKEPAGYKGHME